jgi:hypothetical protein
MSRGCAQLADLGIEIQELPEAVECLPVHGVRLVPDLDEAGVVQQAAEVSSHASRRLVFDREVGQRSSDVVVRRVPDQASPVELAGSSSRVQPVEDGTFSDGTLAVTIDVTDTADGPVFDWTSNIGVDAVFVKGGPGGLIYVYDPPAESTGDTGLRRPVAEARPCSSWPASSCSSAEAHCSAAQSLGRVGLPDA